MKDSVQNLPCLKGKKKNAQMASMDSAEEVGHSPQILGQVMGPGGVGDCAQVKAAMRSAVAAES